MYFLHQIFILSPAIFQLTLMDFITNKDRKRTQHNQCKCEYNVYVTSYRKYNRRKYKEYQTYFVVMENSRNFRMNKKGQYFNILWRQQECFLPPPPNTTTNNSLKQINSSVVPFKQNITLKWNGVPFPPTIHPTFDGFLCRSIIGNSMH